MILTLALLAPARATSGFDATAADATFTAEETYTQDGAVRLWSSIERIEDPDRRLFEQERFTDEVAWPTDAAWAPWIDDCFGTTTPASWLALLHVGPSDAAAHGTPILFVPGAGDNGSRGFITMATHQDRLLRPVYALTFAHPHGDAFQQAEIIADAIARIKARTGAAQVDVVSHSKGGIATLIYLSNLAGTQWPDADYMSVGTRYRGDVRRAVFIATPLGGIDTAYRWPNANLLSLDGDAAIAPTSWSTYGFSSLADQDFLSDGQDYFPGHRQLLARQDPDLPGEQPWLGSYSLQQDWYTTYEGGVGFVSTSEGIDAAIQEGGGLINRFRSIGVDPGVEIYLLAGQNPLMPNGTQDWILSTFEQQWVDLGTSSTDAWAELLSEIVGNSWAGLGYSEGDVQGLAQSKLILGEITAESDGLVFLTSALDTRALTARGATVAATRVADLSHLDLLYASPITGDLLIQEAARDPLENGWMEGVGARYTAEDTIGQVELWLDDPDTGGDDTGPTDDTGPGDDTGPTDDTGPDNDDTGPDNDTADSDVGGYDEDKDGRDDGACGGCSAAPGAGWLPGLIGLGLIARRRRI